MTQIILNKFDRSISEDIRDLNIDEHESSSNFKLSKPNILESIPDTVVDTTTGDAITDLKFTDVILDATSNKVLVALGKKSSASLNLAFFTSDAIGNAWTIRAQRSSSIVIPNTLIAYGGLAYALDFDSDTNLIEFTNNTTATEKGALSGVIPSSAGTVAKPFIHPEDGYLYFGIEYVLGIWNGTKLTKFDTLLPVDKVITSLTDYGGYLVIGTRPKTNVGNSYSYLWGRDTTLNITQGIIDWGFGSLIAVENIGNILVAVMLVQNTNTTINTKLQLKVWAGGEVVTVKEITLDSTVGTAVPPYVFKSKTKNSLYFTLSGDTCIWKVTKNSDGQFTLNRERYIANGSTPSSINGFSLINDIMWAGYSISGGSTNTFFHNKLSSTSTDYTNTCIYKTTVNPNMPIEDRSKKKQLKNVRVSYTGASSGTTVLKYYTDAGSVVTIHSDTNTAGQHVFETGKESDGKALNTGREFQFEIQSTGNSKVKEIMYEYETIETR